MRDKYLGDSYDIVKRFWSTGLRDIAPLYAHPRFVPPGIRERYAVVTSIPVLDPEQLPNGSYGLLLDPDTGIPQPGCAPTAATPAHAPLPFILSLNAQLRPAYIICFDQSYHRQHELDRPEQRRAKRRFLEERGIGSFYYVSHAPFLFAAEVPEMLVALRARLVSLGVPETRFEF